MSSEDELPAARSETKPRSGSKRSAARMGAVQALYQLELSKGEAEKVIQEFLDHRLDEAVEGLDLGRADWSLLSELVRGTAAEAEMLDNMLSAVLADGWPIERLEVLLKVILRAGTYELAFRPEIPARVVIKEYVNLAQGFFSGGEPGMTNGVLDHLARDLRPEEFEAAAAEPGGG